MKIKSKWIYNYGKLPAPMVSASHYTIGDKLYFTLSYGRHPWRGLILELDLLTQECRTVFEEKHIVGSPDVYEDGRFYFTSFRGVVMCVGVDGSLIWETAIGKGNPSKAVLMDGDRLYASNNSLFCLDKKTGEIMWTNDYYNKRGSYNISCNGDYLYSGEQGGRIYCVNKLTGEKRWDYGEEEWCGYCMTLESGRLMVTHSPGKFTFHAPDTGELINTVEARGRLYRAPIFDSGKMYIGDANSVMDSTAGNMTCYEMAGVEMKEMFSVTVGGGISTALLSGDRLFFAAEDSYLYCIDKNTGEELMTKKKTKGICRDIIVGDGELIALSDKGQVECFTFA
ncbi:MAG: PQQ-binding-like beta-propeller repeat protein [Butyrivibrio sp.]|nr:PQQ-binding-like beta-propeller repeat protein [Muribaculum sp.]MCM1553858.1 PQQ-binding-like beta-propeller repeat protein [Butyrivibrio sp.]